MRTTKPQQTIGRARQRAGRWIAILIAALAVSIGASGCTLFFDADPGRRPASTSSPDAGGDASGN